MTSRFDPPAEIAHLVRGSENLSRQAEALVSDYYANTAPGLQPFHLLQPFEEMLRVGIGTRAADEYHRWFSNGDGITHDGETAWNPATDPALVVYVPTLPGHRWPLRNGVSLADVIREARNEPRCDLKLSGDQCESALDAARRILGVGSVAQYMVAMPIARGDLIIVARVCIECWKKFLRDNRIKTPKTGVMPSQSDGFGSAPQLDNDEHRWKGKHPRTREEYEAFLREFPNAGPPAKP